MGAQFNSSAGGVMRTSHTEKTTRAMSPTNFTTGQAGAMRYSQHYAANSPTLISRQTTSGLPVVANVAQSTIVGASTLSTGRRSSTGRVSSREIDTKVSTIVGEKHLVSQHQGASVVKGYNYGQSVQVGENHWEAGIINVTENRLEAVVRQSAIPQTKVTVNEVALQEEEAVIVERVVEKPVEVTVQRKVPKERIVEVPYDVYVEKPIEKNFYKEVVTEKIMEKPREKIVEIPVEIVYERPVEKIIQRRVEFQTEVDVPVERIVENRIHEFHENVQFNDRFQEVDAKNLAQFPGFERLPTEVRTVVQDVHIDKPIYIDNVTERTIEVPVERYIEKIVEKVIEVPLERIIEKPVYVDNLIEKIIDVPVKRLVEKPVEKIVEKPVYIDHIIEHPVAVERVVEKVVEKPIEKIVDVPVYVDNIIEKVVEFTTEVEKPYEVSIPHNVEITKDNVICMTEFNERPIEKTYEKVSKIVNHQTVPVEFVIEREIFVPKENTMEHTVPVISGKFIDREINKSVQNIKTTERLVQQDNFVEIPVRKQIEVPKFIEQVIEKEVPMEKTVERLIERIVERRVEVPVEKIIEVPLNIYTERACVESHTQEEILNYNRTTLNTCQGSTTEQHMEIEDQSLESDIMRNQTEYQRIQTENARLMSELTSLRTQSASLSYCGFGRVEEEYLQLKSRLTELESRTSCVQQDCFRLNQKASSCHPITRVSVQVEDPQLEMLRRELKGLISENCALVQEVKRFRVSTC